MLKRFWSKYRKLTLVMLWIYLGLTAILLIGSWGYQEMAFIYQIE